MTHTRLTLWCEHLQLPSPSVSCVNGPIVSLSLVIGSLPGISGNPMNDWKRIIDIACRLPRRIINTAMPAETIQLQELRLKTCGSGATWRFAGWPWDRKARFFFFFSFLTNRSPFSCACLMSFMFTALKDWKPPASDHLTLDSGRLGSSSH